MDQRLVAASLLYCASKIPAIPNIEEQGDDEKRVEIKVSREIELLESEMDRKSVKKIKEEIVQRKSKLDLVKNQIAAIELQSKLLFFCGVEFFCCCRERRRDFGTKAKGKI
jgi:hypothetical protein